jgi:PAS domain S-box-containing protein
MTTAGQILWCVSRLRPFGIGGLFSGSSAPWRLRTDSNAMLLTKPVRYGGIWHNLPLRAKAAACLLLPLPALALTVIALRILGVHRFEFLPIPAAALELLAFVWVLQATHKWIGELKSATDRIREGESLQGMPPYSWESNAIGRNLESLAATLEQHKREKLESREEVIQLFEDTPAAFLETDLHGAVKRANRSACSLLGRRAEDVCRKHVWEVFGAAEGPTSRKQLPDGAGLAAAAGAFDQEYVRPDGTQLMVAVQVSPRCDITGNLTGIQYFLNDVTPRIRTVDMSAHYEQQLRLKEERLAEALADAAEARRAKSEFLSNVSNDLRVPLNTIIGFVELMLDRKIGVKSAERRECLSDILSSARELTGVVENLLDLSKWESANESASHQTVGLEEFVYDLDHLMQVVSQGRGARIQTHLDPKVQFTTGDRETVRRLVGTFLSYAFKRAPDGGAVVVRTAAEDSSGYRLEVEYSSVNGDHPDNPRLIFDLDSEAELAEAKQLVTEHSGSAGILTPPGRGTVLYAVLQPANEFARRRAAGGVVIESIAPETEALQGLARVIGEISGAENALGARRCHESTGDRKGRPRPKSLAAASRIRSA